MTWHDDATWHAAVAGQAVPPEHPAIVWANALRGRWSDAAARADAYPDIPAAVLLADACHRVIEPGRPTDPLPEPDADPLVLWAWAVAWTARRQRSPLARHAPAPGETPLRASVLRMCAAIDPSPAGTAALKALAGRPDAVGIAARLDLGARTPDRMLATRVLGEALAAAHAAGLRALVGRALRLLARRAIRDGRAAEAVPLLHRALKLDVACDALRDELSTRRLLDEAMVVLRRDEPRLKALLAWRHAARRAGDRALEGWLCSAIGRVALATRHDDIAQQAFLDAADVARTGGDVVSLAADLAGLIEAASRTGDVTTVAWARDEASTLPPGTPALP